MPRMACCHRLAVVTAVVGSSRPRADSTSLKRREFPKPESNAGSVDSPVMTRITLYGDLTGLYPKFCELI